jgi:5-methylcytosine-specific restriction endonuclease McrA
MATFIDVEPTLDNYWRSIILFGRNVASYKFALAKSLMEFSRTGQTQVSYDELAIPYARHIATHLKSRDKQGTSGSSKFLDACRRFNAGEIAETELHAATAKLGFNNVIDAFHVVNEAPVSVNFFSKHPERKGIVLSDDFFRLSELMQFSNLSAEVDSRWQLVETAWQLNISRNLIGVVYDSQNEMFFTEDKNLRRVNITSSRGALNGYQKGKCFYCFSDLSISADNKYENVDIDHFLPHSLNKHGLANENGVWNLVLSCATCNRGEKGKFQKVPELLYLERLHRRNEFLIDSHHPLRETLMQQTGTSEPQRIAYLNHYYQEATRHLIHKWRPTSEHPAVF